MMKMFRIFLFSFFITLSFGEQLYFENFNVGSWPAGYTFEGNWQVNSSWEGNNSPPAAVYNWSPQQSNYEHHMVTSPINVGDNESVYVEFYFALDFYAQGQLTGLKISYDGGAGWVDVLNYSIGPGLEIQDNPWTSIESFTADVVEGSDLKIRWTSYGVDSWAIDGWIVDDIKVLSLPKLTSVTIESANEDPATASTGTNNWLNFTSNSALSGTPYVQINGTACNIDNLGGNNWVAYYTVLDTDPDGPLQFTINFTDADGLDGSTVKETTNGSSVIVDNSDPPRFTVGTVTSLGGNVYNEIWNTTNTEIELLVNVPQDSAVTSFNYTASNSILFDGVNDEISIPSQATYQFTNTLTIEAWVKPASTPSDYDGFLSYAMDASPNIAGFGFSFYLTGWRFFLKTSANTINYSGMVEAQMPVGQWTHMATTYDGSMIRMYRNGSKVDSLATTGNVEWAGAPAEMVFGNFPQNGAPHFFNGQLDDIRLWNVVRTKQEIKASSEIMLNGDEAGLVGYWQMDESSGSIIADLTATGNSGNINGAVFVIQDSPIDLITPVYDTGVIVGSSFQLRGRFSTNNFEGIGLNDTITIANFNAGIKSVSVTKEAFESLVGFSHGEIAQLSATLFDVAGNFSLGDTSSTNTVVDIIANAPAPVSISSNNTFSHLAKTGDLVTITMVYDEDVETPTVTVDGNNADNISDLGSEQFSSTYTLSGIETEGSLNFTLTTSDFMENPGSSSGSTDGSTVVYDRTIPVVTPVTIVSSNADPLWAKLGDTVRFDFSGNEILYETDISLATTSLILYDTTNAIYDGSAECVGGDIVTDNLKLWLDANDVDGDGSNEGLNESTLNGADVTIWTDKSGNAADVIEVAGQGLPTLVENQFNGQSTLQFNKSEEDVLIHDLGINKWVASEFSLFIVFQQNNSPSNFDSFFSNGDVNSNNYFQITHKTNNGHFKFLSGGEIDFEPWDNDLKLYGVIANASGTSTVVDGLVTNTDNNVNGRSFDKYKINRNRLDFQYNDSYISEILLYDRELTSTELTKTYKYLGNKYGQSFSNDTTIVYTKKIMVATDLEGEIAINIDYNDCAGNSGTTIAETTNGSYVIFDMTAPSSFTVDTVASIGGNNIENAWNSTNTGLNVLVPVENDTTLKNGWIQVYAKIGTNAFEKLDATFSILDTDLNTSKILTFTASQIEAITGFAEEDTITFKAIMSDRPGNETEGSQSIFRLVIDQTPPTVVSSHIASDNSDSAKGKVGDMITLTFQTDEIIQEPTSTISTQTATITDLGSFNWSGAYMMQETDTEGIIPFTVDALMDARGNPASGFTSTSDASQVIFDRTKPVLNQVQANSWNTYNSSWAKSGDTGRIYTNSSEHLMSISATINSTATTLLQYQPSEYDLNYSFTDADPEGPISFEIVYSDSTGNLGDTVKATTNNSFIIFDKTVPSNFTVGDVTSTGGNVVATFWNSTNTGLDVIVPIESDSTLDSGRVQIWAKVGANVFEMLGDSSFILSSEVGETKTLSIPGVSVRAITGFAENDTITIKAKVFDIPGNETDGAESVTRLLIDETPPALVSVSYESDFSDSSLATVGHIISLSFETDVEIQIPSASISTSSASISDLGSNRWTAMYTMQENDLEGIIPFQIDTLTDSRGNPVEGVSTTTDGTQVTFDKTNPTLNPVTILSNNIDAEWAKVGDTVMVNFTADELVSSQVVSIVDQSASIIDLGGQAYTAKYEMTNSDSEGEIVFNIIVTDRVELENDPVVETTDGSLVIFDRTVPTLPTVHIESNNVSNNSIAIVGDIITLSFTPDEPLIFDSIFVTIAGESATFIQDGDGYIATLTLDGDEPGGIFSYTIDFLDRAGNSAIQVISTTDNSYVNHDIVPPEILTVSIASNNLDSTWAKVGDTVFVDFTANEVLDNLEIIISGTSSLYQDAGAAKYRSYHIMNQADSEGEITFQISYTDLGGATGPDADTTTNNSKVRFDKTLPEFSLVRMATNNVYGDSLAGIGTIDTLLFTISETYRTLNLSLAGAGKSPIGDGLNLTTTHTFSDSDIEGWVLFSISMIDSAGNASDTLTTSQDGSIVRFDGTPPTLSPVVFFSSNLQDTTLCIISDSLYLQFTAAETLRTSTITIAGNSPDRTFYSEDKYHAIYGMVGTEVEGFIPFVISNLIDWVGNIGDSVNISTNGSAVLFDMTPPSDFTLGDVTAKNGIEVLGYWNASNQFLDLVIPIENDETLPNGGIQIQASFDGSFNTFSDTIVIDEVDLGTDKTISITELDFEMITGYTENGNAVFKAVLWDKAGNTTVGISSESIIHIDETLPELLVVTQHTNNSIGDSLGKVGDIDTLTYSSNEGLDSIGVKIFNQDAVQDGANRDWTSTYTFQESDSDGLVSFNIVFGDSAGNMGIEVFTTSDGSTILFDGTNPNLTSVSFSSTNTTDSELAIIGDSLFLDFISDENLLNTSVLIAGVVADTTFEDFGRTPYRSWRILDGTEDEGFITFNISFSDLVGNIGDTIEITTDGSTVLFDVTPPADFQLDTVYVTGGTAVFGYWNSTNDSIRIKVPVASDDESLIGGIFQAQVQFENDSYINIGDETLIENIDGTGFLYLGIPRSEFISIDGFMDGINAKFTAIVKDKAGNETVGSSDNTTFHIDETNPELTEVRIYSDNVFDTTWATINNTVTLIFNSSEGLNSPTTLISLDTLTPTSSINGMEWNTSKSIVEGDLEGEISFNISYLDTAGNDGSPILVSTNGSLVRVDLTNPSISNLLEGSENADVDYYNQSDSITLYWSQEDNNSGIRDAFIALGSDSNMTDIIDWTMKNADGLGGWNNLSLSNDGIYFGGAFVRDSAGNHSDTIWGNSIYIDTEIPDTGSIIDGYWVMDLDYTIDSTKLSYRWNGFTDNTDIGYFQIAIGTNGNETNILEFTHSDSTDSMTVFGLDLVRDTLYTTYFKAIDLAGNTSFTVSTDGIYFDNSFPVINKITPDLASDSLGFLSVLDKDTITIKFNRPIYQYELSVNSNVDTGFTSMHEYGDSVITVIWSDTLSSYDTITVIVDSAVAFNTLWVTDTFYFYSKLWGDLNNDYDITIEDILAFNQMWPETDLGPINNNPPHVRPKPDGEVNLTDLSAFAKMWHWRYFNLEFDSLSVTRMTENFEVKAQGRKATFSIPENTAMAEILIGESNLNVMLFNFEKPTNSSFMFHAMDTVSGLKQFSMVDYRGFDSTLTIFLPESDEEYLRAQIQFKFMDKDGIVLSKGFSTIDIDILPDKFTVYDNYPNPFNPITTIRYDLPELQDIDIVIYDLLGRVVTHVELDKVQAGRHNFTWRGINDYGKRVSTGIYFLQLTAGKDTRIQKMLLLK